MIVLQKSPVPLIIFKLASKPARKNKNLRGSVRVLGCGMNFFFTVIALIDSINVGVIVKPVKSVNSARGCKSKKIG